jgi:curved DNA-binding protein CbpA
MNVTSALDILNLDNNPSVESIKKAYKQQALKYHPDRNPNGHQMMQLINEAYKTLNDAIANGWGLNRKSGAEAKDYSQEISDLLNKLFNLNLSGVTVELCGDWVWATGETKTIKDDLKELGFKWACKKIAWFYRPDSFKSKSHGQTSLDEIRNKYNSKTILRAAICA